MKLQWPTLKTVVWVKLTLQSPIIFFVATQFKTPHHFSGQEISKFVARTENLYQQCMQVRLRQNCQPWLQSDPVHMEAGGTALIIERINWGRRGSLPQSIRVISVAESIIAPIIASSNKNPTERDSPISYNIVPLGDKSELGRWKATAPGTCRKQGSRETWSPVLSKKKTCS